MLSCEDQVIIRTFEFRAFCFQKYVFIKIPTFLLWKKRRKPWSPQKCAYLLKPMCCLPPKKVDEIPFGIPANTNSICFHALGDSRPPNSRGLSTHYKDNPAENPEPRMFYALSCFWLTKMTMWTTLIATWRQHGRSHKSVFQSVRLDLSILS